MTDREVLELIFLPGFSTARRSHQRLRPRRGHGRRQDQYRKDRRRGGLVSRLGEGTTLKLKIPLTLAIIPASSSR